MKRCKVKGCTREVMARGYCGKHYRLYLSRKAIKENHLCSASGCNLPRSAKGYCHNHYLRLRKYGRLDKIRGLPQGPCMKEGCKNQAKVRGYCGIHYHWAIACHLIPHRPCKVKGCSEPHYAKGFCRNHYFRLKRYGRLEKLYPLPRGPCKARNCDRVARIGKYCFAHYHRLKRNGQLFTKIPIGGGLNRGPRNPQWKGGVAYFKNHYQLKKNRLKKLAEVDWKCEIEGCEGRAFFVSHKGDRNDHSLGNLKAMCKKCFYTLIGSQKRKLYPSAIRQGRKKTYRELSELTGCSMPNIARYFNTPGVMQAKTRRRMREILRNVGE